MLPDSRKERGTAYVERGKEIVVIAAVAAAGLDDVVVAVAVSSEGGLAIGSPEIVATVLDF